MFAPLMLFICLAAIFTPCFTRIGSSPNANRLTKVATETYSLGKIINLATTNLLQDFKEKETSIFDPFPSQCFRANRTDTTKSRYEYYSSTKDFYSKFATQSGLDASLQSDFSLHVTLSAATQSISSQKTTVSGISLIEESLVEKKWLTKDCLNEGNYRFKQSFMKDLKMLPLRINEPWLERFWKAYDDFLNKYGSHVVNSVQGGAMLKLMVFAKSSKSYSQRDFQVKSCVDLASPTEVGLIGVKVCANVTKSESSKSAKMEASNKLILRGGSLETRNKLVSSRSKELIDKFLNEAKTTPSSVQYTFRAVWSIIKARFPLGEYNYVKALNLQYYYLGFLNYGCPHIESGGLDIQKFDHTKRSDEMQPEYECSLAKEGCHSDNDCHYKPLVAWCSCRGPTCVRYKSVEQDTGVSKETAYANTDEDWGWHGCNWKTGLAGSECACKNKNLEQRKVVWSLRTSDAAVTLQEAPSYGFDHEVKDPHRSEPKEKERLN